MEIRFLCMSLCLLVLSGCASTIRVEAVAGADQTKMYRGGTEVLLSRKQSTVAVRPSANSYTSEQRPTFVVSVLNGTDQPITFSTEDIVATTAGARLKVFSYEELVEEVENQRKWAAVGAALSGVAASMNAAQAGNKYTYGTYNTNHYGSRGYYGSGYGTYSAYTYDSAAAAQAQAAANAQTAQNFQYINASAESALSDLGRTILKKETVMPNQWHGGYVRIQRPPVPERTNMISITVVFGAEEHFFQFLQTTVK